jgi:hypothetical protein
MSTRRRLPNKRPSENFTFEHAGIDYLATISRFPDGGLAEIFLTSTKIGTQADTNARDAAILLSFALQFGADLDAIRKALCRDARGRAMSPVGAVLDLIGGGGQ